MDERIKTIATHYGLEHQKMKLVEEMAELTQDIIKGNNIIEELVDVEIVLEQVKYLLINGCSLSREFYSNRREFKIERQLKRIYEDT